MLVHSPRRWPPSIQHWSVLYAGSAEYTRSHQCPLNDGQCRRKWPHTGTMHDTPTHRRVNGGLVNRMVEPARCFDPKLG